MMSKRLRQEHSTDNVGALYIHVPYCQRKCIYCDFFSGGVRIADWDALTTAYINEFTQRQQELQQNHTFRTIYIGGGTPSLMPPRHFRTITQTLYKKILGDKVSEFTIEVNPDDVTLDKVKVWKDSGVNRISVGVQSFNNSELKFIGRRHDVKKTVDAVELLKDHFENISIDLMFGIPGQTMQTWEESIDRALQLAPTHISAYSLMYEPGTALTILRNKGMIREIEEDLSLLMAQMLADWLHDEGFRQYEISNFAKPGYQSIHNTAYWERHPYLGLGPSAHSYDGRCIRRFNPPKIKEYIDFFVKSRTDKSTGPEDTPYFYETEVLTEREKREEAVMLALRTVKGLNINDFSKEFGAEECSILLNDAKKWIESGDLIRMEDYIRINPKKLMVSDSILSDLI